jgi:hypothetical protein
MIKVSEKCRKILRKIYIVLGASAISVLFAACYGMPMDTYDYDHMYCPNPCCDDEEAVSSEI